MFFSFSFLRFVYVVVSRCFLRFLFLVFLRFRFCHKVTIHNVFFTFSESLGVFALSGSGCPCFYDLRAPTPKHLSFFFIVFVYRRRSVCERFLTLSSTFCLRVRGVDGGLENEKTTSQNLPRRKRKKKRPERFHEQLSGLRIKACQPAASSVEQPLSNRSLASNQPSINH